jgi:hypothetical protein
MTFDVKAQVYVGQRHGWVTYFELFSICRNCERSTIFVVKLDDFNAKESFAKKNALVDYSASLNTYFSVEGYMSLKDLAANNPPEHVPETIANAFREAATCLSIKCHNAAGAMFRLCIDLATAPLLPHPANATVAQPNAKQRRDLGLRLPWLFDNGRLPDNLRELASCIREDGNDGAHAGSLTDEDADDLLDFTTTLLERLYTEPKRLELAQLRRVARRLKENTGTEDTAG